MDGAWLLAIPILAGFALGLAAPRRRFLVALLGVPAWALFGLYIQRVNEGDDTNPPVAFYLVMAAALMLIPYWVGVCLSAPVRPHPAGAWRRRRGRDAPR